eukprot:SAG22_NODE_1253_length_5001_cov_12.062220_1_plen_460_part_00
MTFGVFTVVYIPLGLVIGFSAAAISASAWPFVVPVLLSLEVFSDFDDIFDVILLSVCIDLANAGLLTGLYHWRGGLVLAKPALLLGGAAALPAAGAAVAAQFLLPGLQGLLQQMSGYGLFFFSAIFLGRGCRLARAGRRRRFEQLKETARSGPGGQDDDEKRGLRTSQAAAAADSSYGDADAAVAVGWRGLGSGGVQVSGWTAALLLAAAGCCGGLAGFVGFGNGTIRRVSLSRPALSVSLSLSLSLSFCFSLSLFLFLSLFLSLFLCLSVFLSLCLSLCLSLSLSLSMFLSVSLSLLSLFSLSSLSLSRSHRLSRRNLAGDPCVRCRNAVRDPAHLARRLRQPGGDGDGLRGDAGADDGRAALLRVAATAVLAQVHCGRGESAGQQPLRLSWGHYMYMHSVMLLLNLTNSRCGFLGTKHRSEHPWSGRRAARSWRYGLDRSVATSLSASCCPAAAWWP